MAQHEHALHGTWLLLLMVACLTTAATGQALQSGTIMPTRPRPNVAQFVLDVTLARGAPACGPARSVILINGLFQPVLHANVNDTIRITINNKLPTNLPTTSTGISLHWHGFNMWRDAAWSDGTSYVSQCPIAPGTSYNYSFLADEAPGTYFWHDHSAMNRANGLQGVLVLGMPVRRRPIETPEINDGEHIVFITDWFDMEANRIAMRANRPQILNGKVSKETGSYMGVPEAADAMLINGKGNHNDCNPNQSQRRQSGTRVEYVPVCNVTELVTPPSNGRGGCQHETFMVTPGKKYKFRLINGGTQQYVSVCFEGHKVTIQSADGTPTQDFPVYPGSCVDINSGQRYDVLLEANQNASASYWISVHQQYAEKAPSAYAVLRYASPDAPPLPRTPTPQPSAVSPWTKDYEQWLVTSPYVQRENVDYYPEYYNLFMYRGGYAPTTLQGKVDKVVTFTMSQPTMANGAKKWAMNDVAHVNVQPCVPVMDSLLADTGYLAKFAAPSDAQAQKSSTLAMLKVSTFNKSSLTTIYNTDEGIPVQPVAGMHVVPIKFGDIVDVVINNPYDPNSISSRAQQHPMHLHGHKFWVMGTGTGVFNPNATDNNLRVIDGLLRDTATLPENGWLYLRFIADNPGVWPLHCHIMWHAYMGQMVLFAEGLDKLPPRRKAGPPCPTECINGFAPFSRSYLKKHYDLSAPDFTS